MFKTIFSRLVVIFIAILLVAFSITGVMLYFFLTDFALSEKTTLLENSSLEISKHFQQLLKNLDAANSYEDPVTRSYLINASKSSFEQSLQFYGSYSYSLVWIVDAKGRILFSNSEALLQKLPKDNSLGRPLLTDERQYKKVMSGQNAPVREIGDFYDFFEDKAFASYGSSWLTIEMPLKFTPAGGGQETPVAVYLHTPVPGIQRMRTSVLVIFLQSVGIAILISVLLIYFFSRRLSSPLKQMNEAAKIIAGGEFRKRVSVKSRDEVGELASSFNQMVVALQNLEDMRRGFIANVSHELRTPMTSIRGFIEGIIDGTIPPEKQGYYLGIVRDETNRLNRLVNDLLDLARMEAGEYELNIRSFNINELIRLCVIKLEGLIVEKKLQVEADFEEEDLYVSGDRDAIERVIINLTHNAIKFTPENGKISIGTVIRKDKVHVWVEDNGVGIDKEEIELIWDRFYKSDKSRSRDKTGTGLGLAIIRTIINEHKQRIWVESEPGSGTRFTFTLDRAQNTGEQS